MKFIRLAGFDSENTESAVWDLKSFLFTGKHGHRKVWKYKGSSSNMRPFKGESFASIHAKICGRWAISPPINLWFRRPWRGNSWVTCEKKGGRSSRNHSVTLNKNGVNSHKKLGMTALLMWVAGIEIEKYGSACVSEN